MLKPALRLNQMHSSQTQAPDRKYEYFDDTLQIVRIVHDLANESKDPNEKYA